MRINRYMAAGLLTSAMLFTSYPGAASVKILGVNVDKNDICPNASTVKCLSKPNGATGYYLVEDRDLAIDAKGEPNLAPLLGKIFDETVSLDTNYCGKEAVDPLRAFAAANSIPFTEEVHHNPVHFTVKAANLMEAKGGVDATAVATAAGVPAAQIKDVAAAIEISYSKSKNKAVDVAGIYRYIRINTGLTQRLDSASVPPELKSCSDWLKANPEATLITALTGYQLTEATISTSMKSTFVEKLTAQLGGKVTPAQIASIEQQFSSTVEKTSKLSFKPYFQVLTVARYPG